MYKKYVTACIVYFLHSCTQLSSFYLSFDLNTLKRIYKPLNCKCAIISSPLLMSTSLLNETLMSCKHNTAIQIFHEHKVFQWGLSKYKKGPYTFIQFIYDRPNQVISLFSMNHKLRIISGYTYVLHKPFVPLTQLHVFYVSFYQVLIPSLTAFSHYSVRIFSYWSSCHFCSGKSNVDWYTNYKYKFETQT